MKEVFEDPKIIKKRRVHNYHDLQQTPSYHGRTWALQNQIQQIEEFPFRISHFENISEEGVIERLYGCMIRRIEQAKFTKCYFLKRGTTNQHMNINYKRQKG